MVFGIKSLFSKVLGVFRKKQDEQQEQHEKDEDFKDDVDLDSQEPILELIEEDEEDEEKSRPREGNYSVKPDKDKYEGHVRQTRRLNDEELKDHHKKLYNKIFEKGLNESFEKDPSQLIRNLDKLVESRYVKYAMGEASANYIVHNLLKRSNKLKEKGMDSDQYHKIRYYNLSKEFERAARKIARYSLKIEEHYFPAIYSEDLEQAEDLAQSWSAKAKSAKEKSALELLVS